MFTVPTGLTEDQLAAWAMNQPASSPAFRPTDLRLDHREGLTVTWADGVVSRYSLAHLRRKCPCATCRSEREQKAAGGQSADQSPTGGASNVSGASGATTGRTVNLTILPAGIDRATQFVDAQVVGSYAIQITWGDGHRTGIYDFRYLRVIDPAVEATGR
jgi:DUF971 family protein